MLKIREMTTTPLPAAGVTSRREYAIDSSLVLRNDGKTAG
jgi:hypothetical protein